MLRSDGTQHDATLAKADVPTREMASARILVVCDDYQLRVLVCELIAAHGYSGVLSLDSATALASVDRVANCDVAIVDADAAHANAMRGFRKSEKGGLGSIVIVGGNGIGQAHADREAEGAVLLAKPFDPRELLLVLRGMLLRRVPLAPHDRDSVVAGPLELQTLLNVATVANREVELTGVETRILEELLIHASRPVSRNRLTHRALGRQWSPLDRSLDTHIKRLRRKIGPDRNGRTPIRTIRGIGYLLLAEWQPPV